MIAENQIQEIKDQIFQKQMEMSLMTSPFELEIKNTIKSLVSYSEGIDFGVKLCNKMTCDLTFSENAQKDRIHLAFGKTASAKFYIEVYLEEAGDMIRVIENVDLEEYYKKVRLKYVIMAKLMSNQNILYKCLVEIFARFHDMVTELNEEISELFQQKYHIECQINKSN